jgi:large subunit ribosomal protein L43
MPITPRLLTSMPVNGLGAFILQCKRLDFHYCDWAGSSRGMSAFLKHHLPAFAKRNPQIEICVSPRPHKHPIIRGVYSNQPLPSLTPLPLAISRLLVPTIHTIKPKLPLTICSKIVNGREKVICVRNMEHNQVLQKAELLRNSSGLRLRRCNKPVQSLNESVRGIFSPFHGDGAHKI